MINILKMERYHLFRNRIYWYGFFGFFLMGFITADSYVDEVMGPAGGAATSLSDIFNGMVYDSTFLLILVSSLLALILGQEFSWRTIDSEVCAGHTRLQIFAGKTTVYLIAFHLMALVYPIAGCIREYARFSLADPGIFIYDFIKASAYSLILNSAIFLIPVFCCFLFRYTAKAIATTALITFALSLYLGYGMMLHLPIWFLPIFQIRAAITNPAAVSLESLAVGLVWSVVLITAAWRIFRKCELK